MVWGVPSEQAAGNDHWRGHNGEWQEVGSRRKLKSKGKGWGQRGQSRQPRGGSTSAQPIQLRPSDMTNFHKAVEKVTQLFDKTCWSRGKEKDVEGTGGKAKGDC